MKNKKIILFSILIVMGVFSLYFFFGPQKKTIVRFESAKVHYGFIAKSITASGTIQPVDTVSVGAQVSGVVRSIYVDFNSIVKAGQLIASIDPSIIKAQTEVAKANLATAESNFNFQKTNYERQNQLFLLGAISKADFQVATNQYTAAKASVSNTQAQLKISIKNLSYTLIYSPINGIVLNRNVSEGQTIASSFNAPTLFVIAKDLSKMQVRAAVDEADIGGVQSGQSVSFTVDAFPDIQFGGSVDKILLHPSINANVVTYKTLINIDNSSMKLKPGMTANIYIYTEQYSHILLVPSKALNFKPDSLVLSQFKISKEQSENPIISKKEREKYRTELGNNSVLKEIRASYRMASVWLKRGDSLIEKRILIGINDDSNVSVIAGLKSEEAVVISAISSAKSKDKTSESASPFMPKMQRRPSGRN